MFDDVPHESFHVCLLLTEILEITVINCAAEDVRFVIQAILLCRTKVPQIWAQTIKNRGVP